MNPLDLHRELTDAYRRFVLSSQHFKNLDIEQWVNERISDNEFLWRDPLLTIRRRFRMGEPLESLVGDGILHEQVLRIFSADPSDPSGPPIKPYEHQSAAIRLLCSQPASNTVVATGTGSGKSFAFSIPVISEALRSRERGEGGVKAVLVYPMNALANSQYEDLAARLHGSGLTIVNYTSDLKTTEQAALSGFEEITGRPRPFDSEVICRDHVRDQGVDILITNYVMLELILTRFQDRQIFPLDKLGALQFLVLDEVHTYTGRQGADVACLVRRLKEHTGTGDTLRCVGTSATVDSDASEDGGRAAVAEFATDLFGAPFTADGVITERYAEPLTPPPAPLSGVPAVTGEDTTAYVAGRLSSTALAEKLIGTAAPTSEQIAAHPAVGFLEHRAAGEPSTWMDIVDSYRQEIRPVANNVQATAELEAALIAGSKARVAAEEGEVPLLIPKVHTFISQGRPITSTLCGDLSDRGELVQQIGDKQLPAFPVVFCNACGAEALSAVLDAEAPTMFFSPAEFNAADTAGNPGYLFMEPWDPDAAPADERRIKQNGAARKGWEGAVPQNYTVNEFGVVGEDGEQVAVAWVPRPLFLCPSCGVQYNRQQGEYQKFFQAGMAGRATATDVLLGEILQRLDRGRKASVIAFADNRQDTAFQAAHANDYQRRVHFRRALHATLVAQGANRGEDSAVPLQGLGNAVFATMDQAGSVPEYAALPDITVGAGARARENDYKSYLDFVILADLVGRTRFRNNRTLHDVAALDVFYSGIRELAGDSSLWADVAPMASATPEGRHDTLRGILDTVRVYRAIAAKPLLDGDSFREDVIGRLADAALFHDPSLPPSRPEAFSDEIRPNGNTRLTVRRFTFHEDHPRDQGLVRWVRTLHPGLVGRDEAKAFLQDVVAVLAAHNLLLVNGNEGARYFQLHEEAIRIAARHEDSGRRCPKCQTRWQFDQDRVCPQCAITTISTAEYSWAEDYTRAEYLAPLDERQMLVAEEHSAQVPGDERKQAETRFKDPDDQLNTLICTPTMELGIDIGGLSAVYLRNVPPSPANYAQRQGRAGRHGQPAYVATFCGTAGKFGSHDQYFYRFPERIVAGRVFPPRFLLENRDLLEAHCNSLVLEYLDFKIQPEPELFIDFSSDNPYFLPDTSASIELKIRTARGDIVRHIDNSLGPLLNAVALDDEWVAAFVDGFPARYEEAWQPLIAEFTTIQLELRGISARQEAGDLSKENEIRRTSILKRMNDIRNGQGDFYPYRYLGSQGFLPNYAFPRRASRASFNDRKDSIARHRATALREFAPEASIYYRGARYRVERLQAKARGGEIHWNSIKQCGCGAFVMNDDVATSAVCTSCGDSLTAVFAAEMSVEMPDAVGRRRGRISSDAEERLRRGYAITTSYQMPPGAPSGELSAGGEIVAQVRYGHLGRILLTNRGFRGQREEPDGFRLCQKCLRWILSDDDEQNHVDHDNPSGSCPAGGDSDDIQGNVILFVEGRHDLVELAAEAPLGLDADRYMTTLAHALAFGFQIAFSADESEIDHEVYRSDDPTDPAGRIVFYEREEGGAGLLHHLIDGPAWQRVARRALEVLHIDPDTGEPDPDACTRACYDCLLSFFNQFDHDKLDRNLVVPWLQRLAIGDIQLSLVGDDARWAELLGKAEGTESDILKLIRKEGCHPPARQHDTIVGPDSNPIAEADLAWDDKIVCFVDGSPHQRENIKRDDERKRRRLRSLGYKVVAIDAFDPRPGIADLKRRLRIDVPTTADQPSATPTPEEPAAPAPLPTVELRDRSEITPYKGWLPFYRIDDPNLGEEGAEAGWVNTGTNPSYGNLIATQIPGATLQPDFQIGDIIVLELLGGVEPVRGRTTLVRFADGQVDPDTDLPLSLRAWQPDEDEGELVGLSLGARPGSKVPPLTVSDPSAAEAIASFAYGIEISAGSNA